MKTTTAIKLGALALVASSAAMAGTVEVRPVQSATPLTETGSPCNVVAGRCSLAVTGNAADWQVIVVGLSQPQTSGATLSLTFSGSGTGQGISMTSANFGTLAPTAGGAFNAIVATPDPGSLPTPVGPPVASCAVAYSSCLITVLAPTTGTLPSGTVYAMVLGFHTTCSSTCDFLVNMNDDGGDFSWSAADASSIANTYTQAHVGQTAVPLPAAAWLMGTALLAAGRFNRRRKAA